MGGGGETWRGRDMEREREREREEGGREGGREGGGVENKARKEEGGVVKTVGEMRGVSVEVATICETSAVFPIALESPLFLLFLPRLPSGK